MAKTKKTEAGDETPEVQVVEKLSDEVQTSALATIKTADLTKLTELDKEIARYKEQYSGLTIEDENDNEGYEKVRLALGEMRPKRTSLLSEKKAVTEPYRNAVALINSKYSEKINEIAAIEAPLKERKKEIDNIEEELKAKKILEEEARLNNRINELQRNGMAFDGEFYSISAPELGVSETSIGVVDVRTMSDDLYKNILQTVIDKNTRIISETERIQKEKEAEAERVRLKDEADRLAVEQQQKELDEKQRLLDEQQNKMQEQMRKMQEAQNKSRIRQLTDLGMSFNAGANAYTFHDVNIDIPTELSIMDSDEWDALIQKITPVIAERKNVIAEKELKELFLEKRKTERETELRRIGMQWILERKEYWFEDTSVSAKEVAELEDADWMELFTTTQNNIIAAKNRIAKEIADKAIADKAEQDRKDEELRKENLAAQKDAVKWDDFIVRLREMELPEMTGRNYKARVNKVRDFIASL